MAQTVIPTDRKSHNFFAASVNEVEEGSTLALDYKRVAGIKAQVIPVVAQDIATGQVLIIAYANKAALEHTIKKRLATFWSISRNELWVKGGTSGDFLDLIEVRINCEQNSALYLVRPRRTGACHTKDENGANRVSCFYRRITSTYFLEKTPEAE
jgi:phosphoribosyl-AMP cyclohydrolase